MRQPKRDEISALIFFRFLLKSCLAIRTVKLHTTKTFDPEILSLLAAPARDDLRELHLTVSRVAEGGHDEFLELVRTKRINQMFSTSEMRG